MSLKLKVTLFLGISLYLLATNCHVTDAQDPNQPNGNAPQMTPEPPTSTTKKSSFFKGIKNWFKGSTTTPAPVSGAGAALIGSIHTGSLPTPTSSSQSTPGSVQPTGSTGSTNIRPSNLPVTPTRPTVGPLQGSTNREFGGQNVRPGNFPGGSQASLSYPQVGPNGLPIRPSAGPAGYPQGGMLSYPGQPGGINQGLAGYPTSAPGVRPGQPGSQPQPPTNRDFVNTNIRPGSPTPSSPSPSSPTPSSPTPSSPVPSSPTPARPTPGSSISGSPTSGSPTGFNFGPVQPGSRPQPQSPTNRDYVNTNIRPGTPGSPTQGFPTYPQSGPGSSPVQPGVGPQPQSPTNRDYVNPNARPGGLPGSPTPGSPVLPGQGQMFPMGGVTPTSTTNFPTPTQSTTGHRDFVNTTPKTPSSVPGTPAQQPGSPVSPWGNTPQPTNQNNPLVNKDDFPPLPAPGSPGRPSSPGRPGRPGVSFVPRPSSSPTGSTTPHSNQLATDDEITALTETLFTKDVNNQNKHVTINYQGQTRSSLTTDEAPNPLLQVNEEALHSPTIEKLRPLFNNYELDTTVNEHVTPMERKEENELLDAFMATSVMRQAMLFLQNKGLVTPDPKTHRDLLKTIWFTLYSRGGGRIGSSAFEHIFLSEIKNNTVTGLHNWVYYLEEERMGHIDYKGYIKKLELGNKGAIVKFRFNFKGIEKPVNSMFIGTSPELEMALYTVCFQVRPDKDCPVSLGGNKFKIQTYSFRYRGKTIIGSAFPEI